MQNFLRIKGLGREIRGVPTRDQPTGLFVKPDGFQGWEGLPAGRREALARAVTDGEHDVPVRLPARVVTVDGLLVAQSLEQLRNLAQKVTGWGAAGDRFTLSVEHQDQVLRANVRRILGEVDNSWTQGEFVTTGFQLQFLAADPRKYGDLLTLPETGEAAPNIRVYHHGNFPAFPVIEIHSAPSGYTITTPAGVFTVAGATAGGTHRVDLRSGRVTRDGVWMPDVGRGPLWACPDESSAVIKVSTPSRVLMTNTYV